MMNRYATSKSIQAKCLLGCVVLIAVSSVLAEAADRVKTAEKSGAGEKDIPALAWTAHSDWINVQTDVTPRAVGDGKADETEAIQTALDKPSRE